MEPGFRNIDRARKGQLLARDRSGEIRAPADGMVILPLYQGYRRIRQDGGGRLVIERQDPGGT